MLPREAVGIPYLEVLEDSMDKTLSSLSIEVVPAHSNWLGTR